MVNLLPESIAKTSEIWSQHKSCLVTLEFTLPIYMRWRYFDFFFFKREKGREIYLPPNEKCFKFAFD